MIARSKLLTTVSSASIVCRYVHIGNLHQTLKILHMSELPVKHLLLGNLRKCASVPEALYSTYINYINCNIIGGEEEVVTVEEEFCGNIMEPIIDMCIAQSEPTNCQMPSKSVMIDGNSLSGGHQYGMSKKRYKELRPWEETKSGISKINKDDDFALRLLTYNILAQNLLETHSYLYKYHNKNCLSWEGRKPLIVQEIIDANAHVICIQEMQAEHLHEFLVPFQETGFDYLYKKRTNERTDGLLLLFKREHFKLVDYVNVEYHQTTEDILNRDNVGIVAKFSLKESPDTHIVISTTHLLYNPKRNDVRLAQMQVLLAELERIAFIENTRDGPKYHPIILCGDFNLQPYSGVYRFIIDGSFQYLGKGRRLEDDGFRRLTNCLIPSSLLITDNCQHFNVLSKRIRGFGNETVMLDNGSENHPSNSSRISKHTSRSHEVNTHSTDYQKIEIADGHYATFCSGILTHPFNLRSVYIHRKRKGQLEATTNQDEWINVDFIFYSDLELLERYRLPTVDECEQLPNIPNFTVGSDHLCLGATFKLKKKTTVR